MGDYDLERIISLKIWDFVNPFWEINEWRAVCLDFIYCVIELSFHVRYWVILMPLSQHLFHPWFYMRSINTSHVATIELIHICGCDVEI